MPAARATAAIATAPMRPRSRFRRHAVMAPQATTAALHADVEDGRPGSSTTDHDVHRGQRRQDGRPDQLQVVERDLRQALDPGNRAGRRARDG